MAISKIFVDWYSLRTAFVIYKIIKITNGLTILIMPLKIVSAFLTDLLIKYFFIASFEKKDTPTAPIIIMNWKIVFHDRR